MFIVFYKNIEDELSLGNFDGRSLKNNKKAAQVLAVFSMLIIFLSDVIMNFFSHPVDSISKK